MKIERIIPVVAAAAAVTLLVTWWLQAAPRTPVPRVSESDRKRLAEKLAAQEAKARIRIPEAADPPRADGKLERFDVQAPALPGAWPQFRGPGRDGVSPEQTPLARAWPQAPKVLWSRLVGEGHAGPAVLDGKIYLLDYDTVLQADVVTCMSLADGKDIWRYSYPVAVKRNHGMSRTVPAVTKEYLVALGPMCHVTCLNTADGKPRWQIDLAEKFGATVPPWYAGQCPLIDAGRAILATGGGALLTAVDCKTGKVVWHTPNPKGWKMTHSSVMPITVAGTKMYVYAASGGVVGVSAKTGKLLWQVTEWTVRMANVPSAVDLGEGRVLVSGGYDAGAMMLRITPWGEGFAAQILFRKEAREFSATQHTPVLYKGHLYAGRQDGELACMDLAGKVLWTSGSADTFGLGPFLIAGGMNYPMDDEGLLTLAEATPARYRPLGQVQAVRHEEDGEALPGHDAWAPMALVGGRLLLRDLTRLVCLDVR